MFAAEEDAGVFRAQFGGERMHPSEKGKGTNWSQWKKVPENLDGWPVPTKIIAPH